MAFLTKRLLRIYPVYWVVTLLLVFFYFLSPSLEQAHRGQLDVIWGSLLLLPQEFMVSGIAWTLSYEIIFYLMFALTFFRSPSLFVVTFSLWVVAILTAALLGFKIGVYELDALLNPVIINFAFGCFAAFLYKRYPTIKHWHWPIWSGAALFATSWLLTHQDFIETGGPIRVLCFGLPSALFIYGVLYAPVRVPRLLTHLGDASYSLYLLHGSVLSVLLKLVLKVKADSYLDNFTGSLLLFVFTLLASSIFYLLLEKPLTKTLYNRFAKRESNPPLKKVVPA
ncbi:peptidoglycan/LPS O-acetylase OafA/YrhL [Pontibacter ummariensis]|uniref:Peptidoglycan/LPS O-acetylase OafA/YrhL, contains acyltransferase and SGNH-hydrolase domains n=2 Tax=Pontibacter ummariensis TaxID=1610492 RepID=A0A239GH69_9BACT|nr:peptidoglycan/LPS O-acetylase OafA/YrhL [Pontibacter ummariensis]SNS68088.1 Peptidoglycan/LPS O-acetylase OafA/YrhL, contains acyltransferase and SGNH-hydrolase domains [Pontibacter ummariensis]